MGRSADSVFLALEPAPQGREALRQAIRTGEDDAASLAGERRAQLQIAATPEELFALVDENEDAGTSVSVVLLGPVSPLAGDPWRLAAELGRRHPHVQIVLGFDDDVPAERIECCGELQERLHLVLRPLRPLELRQTLQTLRSKWRLGLELHQHIVDLEQAAMLHEAEILQQQRDLADTLDQLQKAHMQLLQADKMASIGQLAAGVAHEINNPIGFVSSNLSSLAGYLKDLKRILSSFDALLLDAEQADSPLHARAAEVRKVCDELDLEFIVQDVDELIDESLHGAQRVRRIVADLRDFSHVGRSRIAEEDLAALLERTINVAWNELKYKCHVEREFGDIPPVRCYGGKLGQVFLNLLVNAAQAIEKQGTITVRTGVEGDRVWVEVVDDGCGMTQDVQSRIFEPFYTTKPVGKGTGLGLHLAYSIIQAHGGDIHVESEVGVGSTFRVELPLGGPEGAEEEVVEPARAGAGGGVA